MSFRRPRRRTSPAARRHLRRYLDLVVAAQREVRRMDARCVRRPDGGYGVGGTVYPWGWEPASPETQDVAAEAARGVWQSRRRAVAEIARLRGWNDAAGVK